MAEILLSPVTEHECTGEMIFGSETLETEFEFKQMQNGQIIGTIKTSSQNYSKVDNLFRSLKYYKLKGMNKNGDEIVIEQCLLNSLHFGDEPLSGGFVAYQVILNGSKMKDAPRNEIVVKAALLNVDYTIRVKVDTEIGTLYLNPIKNHEDLLRSIKLLNISGLTAIADISINKKFNTFSDLLSKSIEIIEGFLCISRLADTCFNDWCSISIYQKIEETNQHKLILQKMKSPKEKIPHFRGLTKPAHSHLFYSSAYSGYKGREKELNENYDFRIALEWYLEANIASVLESKYLMAYTCLELLVDRYQAKSGTEFTMNQDVFKKQFFPMLHEYSRDCMINLGLEDSQRSEIYMKLKGANRRSIGAGIVSLLEHLGIKYNDLIGDVNTIIKIRNEITHVGTYKKVDELGKAFKGLYVLLSRIFLKLVNYTDEYFDWVKGDWVHFKDVTI